MLGAVSKYFDRVLLFPCTAQQRVFGCGKNGILTKEHVAESSRLAGLMRSFSESGANVKK